MRRLVAYLIAVGTVAIAALLNLALATQAAHAPFLLVTGAVAVSAWYGGIGPGLVATALAAATRAEAFVPLSRNDVLGLAVFVLVGILITWLTTSLRASEARTSAILESALDAIVTIDNRGRVVEFNPAAERIFGYRRAQALGEELATLIVPPSLRERHRVGFARYLATGEGPVIGRRVEMTGMRADGGEFPVELAITRIRSHGPPMFTGHLRDITDRKVAEEVARRAEALHSVAALAAATAHEINNPLAVVVGNLELLSMITGLDQPWHQRIERATTAARRIQEIVANMSRITRLQVVGASPRLPD